MKTLLKYLKNLYPRMCAGLVTKFFGTLFELMLPFILSHILSNVIGKTLYNIFFWGILMICCSGLACFLNILSNRIASKVSRDFAENLRKDLFKKNPLSVCKPDGLFHHTIPRITYYYRHLQCPQFYKCNTKNGHSNTYNPDRRNTHHLVYGCLFIPCNDWPFAFHLFFHLFYPQKRSAPLYKNSAVC